MTIAASGRPWRRGDRAERRLPLMADIVAKVENRTTLKISRILERELETTVSQGYMRGVRHGRRF